MSVATMIDALGKECITLFKEVYYLLESSSQEDYPTVSPDDVQDELGRFRIWAENIGALQPKNKRTSLEYRLREASETRLQVQGCLEDMKEVLLEIKAIVSGEREEQDDDDLPNVDDELQELMAAISDFTTGLYRISMVLRKATPRDRYSKAASAVAFLPDFDIDYVRNKFPTANTWLIERLGKANARRREYFKYCETHRESLASLPPSEDTPAPSGPRQGTRRDETATRSEAHFSFVPSTSASTYIEQYQRPGSDNMMVNHAEEVSVKSYAKSIVFPGNEGLTLPPRPKESENGSPFECPYCYMIQEVDGDHVWRSHVMQDLQPYVCTFKDCSLKLFSSRHEWFEHELANHRRTWRCDECVISFPSVEAFRAHLNTCYPSTTLSTDMKALISRAEQAVRQIPALDCPLCDVLNSQLQKLNHTQEDVTVSSEYFKKHLGRHLEKLALFALPRLQIVDDENVGSHDALGNHHDHDSLQAGWLEVENYHSETASDLSQTLSSVSSTIRGDTRLDKLPVFERPERENAPTPEPTTEVARRNDNPNGKDGALRCAACRVANQRCYFENDEEKCTRCAKRNLPCGKKTPSNKVLGRKRAGVAWVTAAPKEGPVSTPEATEGPVKISNPNGRLGKLKCQSCRMAKQRCTFIIEGESCLRCHNRKIPCSGMVAPPGQVSEPWPNQPGLLNTPPGGPPNSPNPLYPGEVPSGFPWPNQPGLLNTPPGGPPNSPNPLYPGEVPASTEAIFSGFPFAKFTPFPSEGQRGP